MTSKDVICISIFHHTIRWRSFDQVVTAGREHTFAEDLSFDPIKSATGSESMGYFFLADAQQKMTNKLGQQP